MHVELEIMPGTRRSYFPQVMLGVRLEGTGTGWHFQKRFSAYMTTSTILTEVRQNSHFHLVKRNMRGWGWDTIPQKTSNRTTRKEFPLESTGIPWASGSGQSTLILRTMTFQSG